MPVIDMSGDGTGDWASKGVPACIMIARPFAGAQVVTAEATLIIAAGVPPQGWRGTAVRPARPVV